MSFQPKNKYTTNYTEHPNIGIAGDCDRVFYLLAKYKKNDSKHKGICQISVSKNPVTSSRYKYIVRHNGVLFYYSDANSLFRDWDILTFEGEKTV